MAETMVFSRIEKKYPMNEKKVEELMARIGDLVRPDGYGRMTVCSLFLDTPGYLILRTSLDERFYKEKIRVRSYGVPRDDGRVFFEIKKKFDGVVYKRRAPMTCREADLFIRRGIPPFAPAHGQILRELESALDRYGRPQPALWIGYEREAFQSPLLPDLRLTFDRNIRYRTDRLDLRDGTEGTALLPEDSVLMEIKTSGGMPPVLSRILSESGIFPARFSKVGTAYRTAFSKREIPAEKEKINEAVFSYALFPSVSPA